ncbi:MAG: ATP-dependent zinc metalloprotease FtsH [Candidatus Peregrinibacteria bacterium]
MPVIPPQRQKNTFLYLIIIALVVTAGVMIFNNPKQANQEISLNTFVEKVESGEIQQVIVESNKIFIELVDGSKLFTFKEPGASVYEVLERAGVTNKTISKLSITVADTETSAFWTNLLIGIIPIALIIGFFLLMMRSAQSSNNQAMSFGKSRAKVYNKEKQKTTFDDVAGVEEAKEELREIVDFLKHPNKYRSMGAKIPKGAMLVGAPGTGKTLLARAVAGEADVPFFNISGSEFVEMFVGVGASRVRDLFNRAKRNAPCIVFIDEIDAVGRHRGAGMGGGHDEREQTLNQILTEMDGFETGTNVIVMAATNRPDILDPALLRPGRFDRRIVVDMPDLEARKKILEVHTRKKPLAKNVDLLKIAKSTPGFTGADLENLTNEAAILSAKNNKKTVGNNELEKSIEKVLLGPERKSRVLNKEEKQITAFHEVGHAVVGHLLPGCDTIHKVSIISRGMALGVTWFMPEEDKHLYSKSKFEDELASLLGGYTAEEIFFGEMTTGASNDLEKTTKLARNMVTKFGMSELGPIIYGDSNEEIFLGKDFGHIRNYSEESASKIDFIVKKTIDKAHAKAKEIILKHKDLIKTIAEDLIKKETISGIELKKYFSDIKPPKKSLI